MQRPPPAGNGGEEHIRHARARKTTHQPIGDGGSWFDLVRHQLGKDTPAWHRLLTITPTSTTVSECSDVRARALTSITTATVAIAAGKRPCGNGKRSRARKQRRRRAQGGPLRSTQDIR